MDLIEIEGEAKILDLACGTCDLTIILAEKINKQGQITGVDFSENMLEQGAKKIKAKSLGDKINLIHGDAREIPFAANYFDCVTISFALRNTADIKVVLSEIKRVTKPRGKIVILDIFKPTLLGYRELFLFYFNKLIPLVGKLIYNQYQEYRWLPQSLNQFITNKELQEIFNELELKEAKVKKFILGGVCMHLAEK